VGEGECACEFVVFTFHHREIHGEEGSGEVGGFPLVVEGLGEFEGRHAH
jgi:hypothetical protein